jgi:hypothetical protein
MTGRAAAQTAFPEVLMRARWTSTPACGHGVTAGDLIARVSGEWLCLDCVMTARWIRWSPRFGTWVRGGTIAGTAGYIHPVTGGWRAGEPPPPPAYAGELRWNPRHPQAAPQFRCAACRRWIGKRSLILLGIKTAPHRAAPLALCVPCMDRPDPQAAHARWYPDCPHAWHDIYDHHDHATGTRAGIAAVLGLWPRRAGA